MPDRPDGAALLEEARRTLLETLLPLLPAERRYDGLMVANAMAIAAREAGQGDAALRDAVAALSVLLVIPLAAGSNAEMQAVQVLLEHRLGREIRAGLHDAADARRDAVREYLLASTLARVRMSNPKALID